MKNADTIQKFLLENSNARGVLVHLDQSYQTILSQHDYPPAVKRYLAEVLLSIALLSARIKLNGRMTIQFQTEGAIEMLVAQINDEAHIRGLAKWKKTATEQELNEGLKQGHLVISIFQESFREPFQSVVPIQGKTIAQALAFYFLQSEQLPTSFYLANDESQAVGMLLQQMPQEEGDQKDQLWRELMEQMANFDTTTLLYSDNLPLLQTEFAYEDIRVFDPLHVMFKCSCTINKMENAVYMMGRKAVDEILKANKEVVVTCEYCNHHFAFNADAVAEIFSNHP